MKNNINNKTSPNQMRVFLKRMREGYNQQGINESVNDPKKKTMTMRDMLKITRNINEAVEDEQKVNRKTQFDQEAEEQKLLNYFDDMNVDIKFADLEIYDNLVFWAGTVDGIIQFVYKVTPDEKTTGIEFNYLPDFTADNPDNDLIIKKIESYFDIFYKYWRNNILQN